MPVTAVTPHIVVSDAAAAASWYAQALGAQERRRITLPGGKVMSLELRFGELAVMVADEFPEMDVLGPLSIGGTPVVLHLLTDDVDALWQRALDAGAEVRHPPARPSARAPRRRIATVRRVPWLRHCPPPARDARHPRCTDIWPHGNRLSSPGASRA
jgi:PhnB protein